MKNQYIIGAIIVVLILLGVWYMFHARTVAAPTATDTQATTTTANDTGTVKPASMPTTGNVTTTTVVTTTSTTTVETGAKAGEHCGGNMATAKTCVAGYHCAPDPDSHLPFGDVGGTCVVD